MRREVAEVVVDDKEPGPSTPSIQLADQYIPEQMVAYQRD